METKCKKKNNDDFSKQVYLFVKQVYKFTPHWVMQFT